MIKIENLEVFNFEAAIRGMRNPLNSWNKSDSGYCDDIECKNCPKYVDEHDCIQYVSGEYFVGKTDLDLMQRLYKAGTEHAKFMRQVFVSFDVVAPLYWWKEFDTYKVGTTSNSCSTMYTIHKKPFVMDDFSHEHLVKPALEALQGLIADLNEVCDAYVNYDNWNERENFEKQGYEKKDLWWQIIQLLPSSYNQRRTITCSYANLANMINQRKNHKLDEWVQFCEYMLENAPYLSSIMGGDSK